MSAIALFPAEIEAMHAVVMEYTKIYQLHVPTLHEIETCWPRITIDPRITWRMIRAKTCYSAYWVWFVVGQNPNVTMDIIMSNLHYPFNWDALSMDSSISIVYKLHNPSLPWNWAIISQYFATPLLVQRFPEIPWDPIQIAQSKQMSARFLVSCPDLEWDYDYLSTCGFITIKLLTYSAELVNKPWNWDKLSVHIPLPDIFEFSNCPWNFKLVAKRPDFKYKYIFHAFHIQWQWDWFSHPTGMERIQFYEALAYQRRKQNCPLT